MTRTSFPTGFPNGVSIDGFPVNIPTAGNVYWVDSGDANAADANDGTETFPLATINGAVDKCTASQGDIVFVKPGHAETLSNATTLVIDVAGISIIGLGRGTDRPTVTVDTATSASIPVSAANVSLQNIIFSANFADIAELFTLTAVNFGCFDCKFTATATDMNFVELVDTSTTDNECDGLTFVRCEWIEPDTATTSMVNVDADIDRLTVLDCYIDLGVNGVLSAIAEVASGKDTTNVNIRRNYVSRLVTASAVQLITWVDTTTTNTGILEDNRCRSLDVAGELLITAGSNVSQYNNLSTSAVSVSGYLLPAADS
tara:strand:- start:37 stop:981 length:945 start_codon:yes stop_codon:yes gene_type:complete